MAKDTIQGDRRLQRRYPLQLDLEFRITDDDKVVSAGAGRTENISSGGVLFHAAQSVPNGLHVELAVRWPAVLRDAPFLELRIFGRLIRSKTDRGVLALLDHRISKTRYGQIFFDSLPEYGFTTKREDVERFFKHV